jgi:two-component sensor histidine kinase
LADALEDRISALARAHELIVPVVTATRNFIPEVSLLALFETVLRPHVPIGSDRLVLDGPDVQLEAQRITNLALAVHELATNAAKYGALSGLEGTLHVLWSVRDGALSLQWHEYLPCGSLQPSAQKGFGSRLIQMCIAGQLGGQVTSVADPSGMRYEISFRL